MLHCVEDYYVTWGAASDGGMGVKSAGGVPMPPVGRPLGRLNSEDFTAVVEKGLLQYSKYSLLLQSYVCAQHGIILAHSLLQLLPVYLSVL